MTNSQTSKLNQTVMGETCVRCHTTQDWGTSSWCPNCGFYPTIDADGVKDESWKHAMPVEEEQIPEGNLFAQLPAWFWILMGGIVAIVMTGFFIRVQADEAESTRGLIALGILPFAFGTMAIAHIIASRHAMVHDPRIRFADAIISWFAVWQPSITQLPDSRKRIWSMTWGMTAVVTSLLVIGGIDYNAPFRTEKKAKPKAFGNKVIQSVTATATAAGQGNEADNREEALAQLSDPSMVGDAAGGAGGTVADAVSELSGMTGETDDLPGPSQVPAAETILCVAYGVVTDDDQLPTSFLFAGRPMNDYQHVAEIHSGDLGKKEFRRLAMSLFKKVQDRPAVSTDYDAVWVNPVLVCKLRYVEMNDDGTVSGAEFDSIVRDDSRRTANGQSAGQRGRR